MKWDYSIIKGALSDFLQPATPILRGFGNAEVFTSKSYWSTLHVFQRLESSLMSGRILEIIHCISHCFVHPLKSYPLSRIANIKIPLKNSCV